MFEVLICKKPYSDNKDKTHPYVKFAYELGAGMRPGPIPTKPHAVVDLIRKCWSQDPDKRPTMKDVCKEIATIKERRLALYKMFDDTIYLHFILKIVSILQVMLDS